MKEARDSFLAAMNERHAGIDKAFAEIERDIAKAQTTLLSLGEKAFAEAQKCFVGRSVLMATGLAP